MPLLWRTRWQSEVFGGGLSASTAAVSGRASVLSLVSRLVRVLFRRFQSVADDVQSSSRVALLPATQVDALPQRCPLIGASAVVPDVVGLEDSVTLRCGRRLGSRLGLRLRDPDVTPFLEEDQRCAFQQMIEGVFRRKRCVDAARHAPVEQVRRIDDVHTRLLRERADGIVQRARRNADHHGIVEVASPPSRAARAQMKAMQQSSDRGISSRSPCARLVYQDGRRTGILQSIRPGESLVPPLGIEPSSAVYKTAASPQCFGGRAGPEE